MFFEGSVTRASAAHHGRAPRERTTHERAQRRERSDGGEPRSRKAPPLGSRRQGRSPEGVRSTLDDGQRGSRLRARLPPERRERSEDRGKQPRKNLLVLGVFSVAVGSLHSLLGISFGSPVGSLRRGATEGETKSNWAVSSG